MWFEAEFSAPLLQFSMSHDLSENIIMCNYSINYYWCSIINTGSYYYHSFWEQFLLVNIFVDTFSKLFDENI